MSKRNEDRALAANLFDVYRRGWFTAKIVRLPRERLRDLEVQGLLESAKQLACSTINYRVKVADDK